MPAFLFWLFAGVMLIFGALVVINRNPIASALSLVVCFLGLAALFMSLDAFFIGIIQVLVYAGAVMVLFLFIIMLLDLRAEERRTMNWVAFTGGFVVAFSLLVQILAVISRTQMAKQTFPPLASRQVDDVRNSRRYRLEQTPTPMTTLGDYLTVSGILFAIGFSGVLLRRNVIIIFMALELMLNAANLSLVAFSRFRLGDDGLPNYNAQVLVFFIITVAAAEVAVGLAIIVALYRARRTTHVEDINSLKF
jgi:NADH:ubiquinone oxidoreductase subunit K/NADH:ubiquinone oxidoreductase subunit 6 (subunit J)